ncbi:MAG: FlgO family outer membrane protein [Zoogloea sp.]|uniref:FlgO family outer membrane protein n=1 Tax=Zoogloea sp. TaxID=49181 RepID=UPI002639EB45|nr:FlgO family outer membrane protein [Zoogloea sp.]MDD3326924.1 FlgO family outer membrane protein [Zoogloea sp.]
MRPLIYAALAVSSLLLGACESVPKTGASPEPTYEQAHNNAFNAANYSAVTELLKRYPAAPATANNFSNSSSNAPFIVATLVNIDQLEQSSTLGRLISEQVASRMTQMGYGVLELKVRNGIYMKRNEGELLLTREIKEVATTHNAQAVIVGTYAESSTLVYVNLKIVNPATSVVLAAYDYALPLDKQIQSLIRKR